MIEVKVYGPETFVYIFDKRIQFLMPRTGQDLKENVRRSLTILLDLLIGIYVLNFNIKILMRHVLIKACPFLNLKILSLT